MSHLPNHDETGQLALGEIAPDFNLPGVDGKNHALSDYAGSVKAFGVIFSCNHCPYVIATEERMIALQNDYRVKGVEFVAINANNVVTHPADSFDKMKERAQQKRFPFAYLYDESQEVAHAYGAKVTPHVFIFDGDMKLRYRGAIDDNVDNPSAVRTHYVRDALDAILSGGSVPSENTQPRGCSVKWK